MYEKYTLSLFLLSRRAIGEGSQGERSAYIKEIRFRRETRGGREREGEAKGLNEREGGRERELERATEGDRYGWNGARRVHSRS